MKEKILLALILALLVVLTGCYTKIFPPVSDEDRMVNNGDDYESEVYYRSDFSDYVFAPDFYYGFGFRYRYLNPYFGPYRSFYNPFFPYYSCYPYYSSGLNYFYLDFLYSGYPPYLASSYLSPWYYDPWYSYYYPYYYPYGYSYYYPGYYGYGYPFYYYSGEDNSKREKKKFVRARNSGSVFERERKSSSSSYSSQEIYVPLVPVGSDANVNVKESNPIREREEIGKPSRPMGSSEKEIMFVPTRPEHRVKASAPPVLSSPPKRPSGGNTKTSSTESRQKGKINRRRK